MNVIENSGFMEMFASIHYATQKQKQQKKISIPLFSYANDSFAKQQM